MAIHSFIQPHEYTLRRAIKAWLMRFTRRETLFKQSFYVDQLKGTEASELVKQIIADIGGTNQPRGRFIIIRGITSLNDIGSDYRPGVGPRSRTIITVQGKPEFVEKVAAVLKEEKERRRQPGKRRTGLISMRKGMWGR